MRDNFIFPVSWLDYEKWSFYMIGWEELKKSSRNSSFRGDVYILFKFFFIIIYSFSNFLFIYVFIIFFMSFIFILMKYYENKHFGITCTDENYTRNMNEYVCMKVNLTCWQHKIKFALHLTSTNVMYFQMKHNMLKE